MNVSFEQLKSMVVFAQIVEQGSFSSAARYLNLSRAVISYHIKKLEQHLGIKLLNRSTRTISLTEAGGEYFKRCRIIAEQAFAADQEIENLKSEAVGLIKITCPVNVGLQIIVPALNQFKTMYPKIELDLMLTDEVVNIIKEGLDFAIRGAPLPDSGLQATKLSVLATCLCASPDYIKQFGEPKHPTELNQHQWVIYKLTSGIVELSKGARSYKVSTKGGISTNNAAARTAFVEGGHGLGRIPVYDASAKIKAGTLVSLLDDYKMKDINLYGVFPHGNASSKKIRLLIDYLKNHFKKEVSNI